ncbi:Class I SAM-dependent methyltransferase [Rubrivivax sp. A210]|uniref:methyltransferase domain-containing protein n=1 Tax=Rubrivivax sp. A210 TaxID=2772301 RepID=UPI001919E257|nr:methyltransferase domain-containing protein [Rubrivivax sp. A210]CAD5370701.1 Class I SAM-dependent methyltransferase [Rubrivivax sp. A210]
MPLFDKRGVLGRASATAPVTLELGCGNGKKNPNAIGIDLLDYPGVDLVGDVYEALAALPDRSVEGVYAYHFIEHVPDVERLLAELSRVVRPVGTIEFVAPHFSNPYFYSDPTHRSFFGLYTFAYYAKRSPFTRQVPTYGYQSTMAVRRVDLIFKSSRSFPVRWGIKRLVGSLFNSCNYMRELYEENFCYLFPCYEVRYLLVRE